MINAIKTAAESVGVNAFITNSTEEIEVQLNRIVKIEQMPIMLVSWDISTNVTFRPDGIMENPKADIVVLLLGKAEEKTKDAAEQKSLEMSQLFLSFLMKLSSDLTVINSTSSNTITNAKYKLVPDHGKGKHSGVLGSFTMIVEIPSHCNG